MCEVFGASSRDCKICALNPRVLAQKKRRARWLFRDNFLSQKIVFFLKNKDPLAHWTMVCGLVPRRCAGFSALPPRFKVTQISTHVSPSRGSHVLIRSTTFTERDNNRDTHPCKGRKHGFWKLVRYYLPNFCVHVLSMSPPWLASKVAAKVES